MDLVDLVEIKGSGGTATFDPAAGTVVLTTRKHGQVAIPLADVLRLEFTIPKAMAPGHVRFFLSADQRVSNVIKQDPFMLILTSYAARHEIAAWFQQVVDAYVDVRPNGTVAEENSFSVRGGLRQNREDLRRKMSEQREARKARAAKPRVTIPARTAVPQAGLFGEGPTTPVAETGRQVSESPIAAPAARRQPQVSAGTVERPGNAMELIDAPRYSMIAVTGLGSTDGIDGVEATVGEVFILWTPPAVDENPFAGVQVCGVLNPAGEMSWLPDDARVEVVAWPRYAGEPGELSAQAKPMTAPEGSKGVMKTAEGVHPLIWENSALSSVFNNWTDPEIAVMELLCALNVAPNDQFLRDQLLATLKARLTSLSRNAGTYPPESYPWRHGLGLRPDDLNYFRGRS